VGKEREEELKMDQGIYRVSIGGCSREIGLAVIYSVTRRQSFLISIYVLLDLSYFKHTRSCTPVFFGFKKEKVLHFCELPDTQPQSTDKLNPPYRPAMQLRIDECPSRKARLFFP
jgi:hypothetical protein